MHGEIAKKERLLAPKRQLTNAAEALGRHGFLFPFHINLDAMKRVEVEAFSQDVNSWVVRTPGRQYPAVVVQGDSLSVLFSLAQSVLERAQTCACNDEKLVGEAEELRDQLWGRLQQYEAVLREHGFELPYNRTHWPR